MIKQAIKLMIAHPFSYVVFYGVEIFKMIFWESPVQQYVIYPEPIAKLYKINFISLTLYTVMPLLTIFSICFVGCHLWKERQNIVHHGQNRETLGFLMCVLIFIILYIAIHAFFHLVDRYSYPLVPLYLILITWSIQYLIPKRSTI